MSTYVYFQNYLYNISVPAVQQQQMKQVPPHLSYSQRIETTSTPLQLPPPPSASLRAPFNNGSKLSSNNLKDGATDVWFLYILSHKPYIQYIKEKNIFSFLII